MLAFTKLTFYVSYYLIIGFIIVFEFDYCIFANLLFIQLIFGFFVFIDCILFIYFLVII